MLTIPSSQHAKRVQEMSSLADEVVHIAAGMLAIGYRGVVATLWSISDYYRPEIAQCFYQYMLDVRCGGAAA